MTDVDGIELVESKTLRSRHLDKVDVLSKVAVLAMLPGNEFATLKQVSDFYGVGVKTVESVIHDHRTELGANGYATLTGSELTSLKEASYVGNYLTADQLRLLDAAVLASTAQLQARYPNGTSVAEMVEVVRGSVALVRPRRAVA